MSNILRIYDLRADLGAAKDMLMAAREYHDGLAIRQFEYRVQMLQTSLDEAAGYEDLIATATFFFDETTSVGCGGVDVSFGCRAMDAFRRALGFQFACDGENDGDVSGLVEQVERAMSVTACVRRSVAFLLEEVPDNGSSMTGLRRALDRLTLIVSQLSADDTSWTSAVGSMDGTVRKAVGLWFDLMDSASASVRIVEGKRDVTLSAEGVALARHRLEGARRA
jgi:hypothetical protein